MSLKYFIVLILLVYFVTIGNGEDDIKCVKCDSIKNSACFGLKNSDGNCNFDDPKELEEAKACYIYKKEGRVVRGYQNEADETWKNCGKDCQYFNSTKDEACNKKCFAPVKCMECNSSGDENDCYKGIGDVTCSTALSCYQCFEKKPNTMKRGCGLITGENCGMCFDSDCNKNLTCYRCEDKNCANSNGQAKVCGADSEQCSIKLADGKTVRDCAVKDESCDGKEKTCKLTKGHLSNDGMIVDDHLKCYKCSGDTDPSCNAAQSSDLNPPYCEKYVENDECYIEERDGKIYRGCKSDSDNVCKTDDKCRRCSTNGCNNKNNKVESTLKCIICDSEKDEKCLYGRPSSAAEKCSSSIKFYENEFCYSKQTGDSKAKRGCGMKDGETCTGKCDRCNTDGCNNKNYFMQTCARCRDDDGDNRDNCTADGIAFLGKTCSNADSIRDDTKGCYVMKHDTTIYRGCIIDLSINEMHMCLKNNTNECQTCAGVDCNTYKLPNASPRSADIDIVTFLFAATGLVTMKLF